MDPKAVRYSKTHEWAGLEGDVCTVGITQYAVDQLLDIVYLGLPEVGEQLSAGQVFGEIESVKAASDLYAPVSGEVLAVNDRLADDTSPIAGDPYGEGWMVKVRVAPGTRLDHLMTLEQYQRHVASEED